MAKSHYDFSGWATRNDVRCSDNRIIRAGAFDHSEQKSRVPLIWNHQHDRTECVLGHADLEQRPDGVYAYCSLNNTTAGKNVKEMLRHGDVNALSIYANRLKTRGSEVLHGNIREVSVVLSGANPEAYINNVLEHSDMSEDPIVYICGFGGLDAEGGYLEHADDEDKEEKPVAKTAQNEETIEDIIKTMDEKQYNVMMYLVQEAMKKGGASGEDEDEDDEDVEHSGLYDDDYYEGDYDEMRRNVFEPNGREDDGFIMHADDVEAMFAAARTQKPNSLKEHIDSIMHAETDYGVEDIDILFPDYEEMNKPYEYVSRNMTWVDKILAGIHKVGYSRIKTTYANITEDEARAKGYIKGNYKKEEVFSLLRRHTGPTTVYKKQKLDRDDITDLKNLNMVAALKTEMRIMLNEELARAYVFGDGRLASDEDHIKEDCIRPIVKEHDFFAIKYDVGTQGLTAAQKAVRFIEGCIRARKDYRGSGNPICITTEDLITECLLLKDNIGRDLFDSVEKLKTKLRVSDIISCPIMEESTDVMAVIVNLDDYVVGTDEGGSVALFEDFDLNYNQQLMLIETRCSGSLRKPFSAIIVRNNPNSTTDATTGFSIPTSKDFTDETATAVGQIGAGA